MGNTSSAQHGVIYYTINNRMFSDGDSASYRNDLGHGYHTIPIQEESSIFTNSANNKRLWSPTWVIQRPDRQKAELAQCKYHPDYEPYLRRSHTPDILTNPNWTPKTKTENAAAVSYLNSFIASKQADGGSVWKRLTVVGGYTPKNLEEMRNSIRVSVYFNFSDPELTVKQILLSLNDIGKLKFSPISMCRSEFYQVNRNGSLVMEVDTRNQYSNRGDCNVEITPATMKLLSYHTRRFISKWVIGRYTRLYRYVKPLYDAAIVDYTNKLNNPAYKAGSIQLISGVFFPPEYYKISVIDPAKATQDKYAIALGGTGSDPIPVYTESLPINLIPAKSRFDLLDQSFNTGVQMTSTISNQTVDARFTATNISFLKTDTIQFIVPTGLSIFGEAVDSRISNTNVSVEAANDSTKNFIAHVKQYTPSSGVLILDDIRAISTTFTPTTATRYVITLATITPDSPTTAVAVTGLSRETKLKILDKIAQRYYELNTTNLKMKKILDVYQIGDTLFDVRFSFIGRDQDKTNELQGKIDTLKQKYLEYRNYTMTQTELLELEKRYLAELESLNTQLGAAVTQVGSPCGAKGRYVLVKPVTAQVIKLSQIQIYNNAGENIAVGTIPEGRRGAVPAPIGPVGPTCGSSETAAAVTAPAAVAPAAVAPAAVATGSTGSAPPPDNSTKLYTDLDEDAVAANRIFDSSGKSTAAETNTKMREVVNEIKRQERRGYLTDGTKIRRVKPYIYESADSADSNFLSFDLGDDFDISFIDLLFPAGEATFDYTITVTANDGTKRIQRTDVISPGAPCRNSPSDGVKRANFQSSASDRNCTCNPMEPFKVARFFADLSGSSGTNISDIDFKGYAEGIEAALSFNPKYNGGFEIDLYASGGNMNYTPNIIYKKNSAPTGAAAPLADMCATPEFGLRIIRDYRINLVNSQFTTRTDVRALSDAAKYNFDAYLYFPTRILSCAKLTSSDGTTTKYALKWEETPVDRKTNVQASSITRWGQFVYTKNLNNWGASDIFYDVLASRMYATEAELLSATGLSSLTALATPPTLSIPLPDETTLDDLFGTCPTRTCSDIDVINQLVSQYNEAAEGKGAIGSRYPNKIQRVVRAATPAPNQCDYEVYMKDSPGTVQKISVFVKTGTENLPSLDPTQVDTIVCKYSLENIDTNQTTAGNFVQSNTPFLVRAYNYAVETAKPFLNSFTTVFNDLSGQVNTQNNTGGTGAFDMALKEYGTSMWNAFGQIKELAGCQDGERGNKCSEATNVQEFLRAKHRELLLARSGKRITRLLGAGTYSFNQCDYTYETRDITVDSNGQLQISNPQSVAERVTMQKVPDTCYFTPTGTPIPIFNNPSIVNMVTYDASGNLIANLAEIATSAQTPTTRDLIANPIKIGETTEAVALPANFTATTQVTLKVESSKYSTGDTLFFRQVGAPTNQFNAKVVNYDSTGKQLTVIDIGPMGTGQVQETFTQVAKFYEIYRIEMAEFPIPQRDPVEFIDCKTPYAAKESLRILTTVNTDIQIRNVDQFTCAVLNGTTVRNIPFTKSAGVDTLTASQDTSSSLTAANFNGANSVILPATTRTAILSVNTSCTTFSPGSTDLRRLVGAVSDTDAVSDYKKNPQTITDRITYEYRVTTNDYLEFGDTFKRVSLYSDDNCRIKIQSIISSSPDTSKFAFFGPNGSGSLGGRGFSQAQLQEYVDRFRSEWNEKFKMVSPTFNKSKVGAVSEVFHHPATDSLFIRAAAADFGVYGETDIRKFGTARIFNVTFREKYDTTTDYFIFRMTEPPVLPIGLVPKAFTDSYTDRDATKPVGQRFIIQSAQNAMKDNGVVFLRFRILAAATSTGPATIPNKGALDAEITRLVFYTTPNSTPTQISDFSPIISFPNAILRMDDISGNYYRFRSDEVCRGGYTPVPDPFKISTGICKVNTPQRYLKLTDTPTVTYPCSIGYEKESAADYGAPVPEGQEICKTTATLGRVLDTLSFANLGTPRLKMGLGKNLYIDLGQKTTIHAFSFITGLADYRPTQWVLEGSMSGLDETWVELHSQQTPYPYPMEPKTSTSNLPIYSFASPAIFSFRGLTRFVINYKYSNNVIRNDIYSQLQTENYKTDTIAATKFITESFINPQGAPLLLQPPPSRPITYTAPPITLKDSYTLPLQVEEAPHLAIGQPLPVPAKERISHLRFRTIDTVDPTSKFVHMSMFQLITPLGPLGANYLRVSNPMGSRKTPREGPDAVLGDPTRRWVDYNKGVLLFKLTGHPPTPIQSFQFAAPVGVPSAEAALPSEWILEGSLDGRTWSILAEGDGTTGARLLQEI